MYSTFDAASLRSRDSNFSAYHDSNRSNNSYHSYDTAPTDYSSTTRPPFAHHDTCHGRLEHHQGICSSGWEPQTHKFVDLRTSTETYASTIDFEDDDDAAEWEHDPQLPQSRTPQGYSSDIYDALPATPADFAELFPSSRQICIKHDDSTDDGNMNLRLDTSVDVSGGRHQDITLFHLRMHDLKKREFSLRRYCRDSGREVCHSVRKYQKTGSDFRPGFGRSFSNALNALKSSPRPKTADTSGLKRSDSGYESITSYRGVEILEDVTPPINPSSRRHAPIPTNTTKLEFSNYAQVEVKRRGTAGSKRYEFEYWGIDYTWKKVVQRHASSVRTSYHLYRANDAQILARIEPSFLSLDEADEERRRGGWVPPCNMWIDDKQILQGQNETSDVVVASGLIALVDDCIKQRFHPKQKRQFVIPIPRLRVDVDYIGTKGLFKEMMNRSGTGEATGRRPTAPRTMSHDL